ncbi:hypothetical protein EDD16DRAFT_961879 [Pisolithus croceorrhizus]|nr:hypothetical protein EV401DRAFT_1260813 [Pisolithus croceorrhizus]KAI6131078.1 hypothetical protein EDD16DRAFT_961879 [Pisolithus croceorrhizus]
MTCREGHQDLCGIGILHRDISENNTVLSPYRGGLGALIDFDMATVGCPSLHLDCPPPPRPSVDEIVASLTQSLSPPPAHDKPYEAECICPQRAAPYPLRWQSPSSVSLSFFFISYEGPPGEAGLRRAKAQGFGLPVGEDRLASHYDRTCLSNGEPAACCRRQTESAVTRTFPSICLSCKRVISTRSFAMGTWSAVGGTDDCAFDPRVLEDVFWSRRTQSGTRSVRRGSSGVVEPLCK